MTGDEPTFSAADAVTVQRELRRRLGLPEERFPLPAFVGMISDEIEQLHAAGISNEDIAQVIGSLTGEAVGPADIDRYYAPPEARRRPS